MTEQVEAALRAADVIVFCPSNPVLSIAPILAVPGVRAAVAGRRGVCVAVSPFIGGRAVKGPASKLLPELGLDISPRGVADYYAGLLDGLVVDAADKDYLDGIECSFLVTNTLMQLDGDKVNLAEEILTWVGSIG